MMNDESLQATPRLPRGYTPCRFGGFSAGKGSNRRLESGLYVPNKRRRDVLPLRTYGLTPLRSCLPCTFTIPIVRFLLAWTSENLGS